MMSKKILVANWKENPETKIEALELFRTIAKVKRRPGVEVIICPPAVYLEEIAGTWEKMRAVAKKNLALGAQDVFWQERGAFTGSVGPKMLRSLGARYVIIGHSERRKYAKETDAMINKKIGAASKDGLHVILCVGESLTVRKKGIAAARSHIKNQLKKDLAGIRAGAASMGGAASRGANVTIAYEPIWAIGTGRSDKPEDAVEMARFIKKELAAQGIRGARFLYGGSVNGENIADYVQYKEIDGALVGGASLNALEFKKIITTINNG